MNTISSAETMSSAMAGARHYHDWVFQSFAEALRPGAALEVGTGHGEYARRIAPLVQELIVSDLDPAAIEKTRAALASYENVHHLVMNGVDPRVLGRRVDNIILLNVLEHVEDDAAFLRNAHQSLSARGVLVVFVPAFPALYSRMDRQAGHVRRYERRALGRLIEDCGFATKKIHYVNAVGFFGWLANKWLDSGIDSTTTNLQIALYDRMIPLFRHVDRALPFLGQSLLAIAEKTG